MLALIGGASLERSLHALRAGGRVAWPNGVEEHADDLVSLLKELGDGR